MSQLSRDCTRYKVEREKILLLQFCRSSFHSLRVASTTKTSSEAIRSFTGVINDSSHIHDEK
jgi:hypothetical protein